MRSTVWWSRLRWGTAAIMCVLVTLVSLVGAPGVGTADAEAEVVPELAGTTRITFNGTSGIRLNVPEHIWITAANFDIELEGADAAFGVVSPLDLDNCRAVFARQFELRPPEAWCQDYTISVMDGWMMSPYVSSARDEEGLPPGRIDLHVVTEGTLTLTLTVPALSGTTSLVATGSMAGAVVKTPVQCVAADLGVDSECVHQGWGGQVLRDVPANSKVGSVAFSQRPNNISATGDQTPGSIAVRTCIYPSFFDPDKTAKATDHPRGCDEDDHGPMDQMTSYAIFAAWPLWLSMARLNGELIVEPTDKVYAGFQAHSVEAAEPVEGPGKYGAYSYWMARQITCNSGNWTNCG